ncbi:MAG: cupin domain-containing protein [Oscillospiraceae bacterium]|jgi:mannose-6-phosphate isomerase-like protein (cupin superfamily)|nr:cupin domain-containing protein [Oscillospiraceae bacterium]
MDYNITDVSLRLKATREYLDIGADTMAEKTNTDLNEYLSLENGEKDFSLSFLNECAGALGVELIELLTGRTPTLKKYSVVRNGKGLPIERREGFAYTHLAYLFKHKKIEPLMVLAPYDGDERSEVVMSVHDGQEMDLIISGKLKFVIGEHEEILEEGDCVYYDSKTPHGMVAVGGRECKFLAVLI